MKGYNGGYGVLWTEEDTQKLSEMYARGEPFEEIAKVLGRSVFSTRKKRQSLMSNRESGKAWRRWRREEKSKFRSMYVEGAPLKQIARVLGKSLSAIKQQRVQQSMRARRRNASCYWWGDTELSRLRKMYYDGWTFEDIAAELGRSVAAVQKKRQSSLSPRLRSSWRCGARTASEGELERIRELLGRGWTFKRIARELNREVPFISRRARAMGLSAPRDCQLFSEAEDTKLHGLKASGVAVRKIAQIMGRSVGSIVGRWHRLQQGGLSHAASNNIRIPEAYRCADHDDGHAAQRGGDLCGSARCTAGRTRQDALPAEPAHAGYVGERGNYSST